MAGMDRVLIVNMTVKELDNNLKMKINSNDQTLCMKMTQPFYAIKGSSDAGDLTGILPIEHGGTGTDNINDARYAFKATNVVVSMTQPVGQIAGDIWLMTRDE